MEQNKSGRLLTRARKRLWLSGLGRMAGEPSLLYTVIGVLLQLLPSIRRCNCYLIDLVVTKSPATTTSNQPTSRSGTNTRAAARVLLREVRVLSYAGGTLTGMSVLCAHMISPHGFPIDPSYRGGKGYHRYIKKIKKVGKQFVRAGRGTRPSREGRAEGGVR